MSLGFDFAFKKDEDEYLEDDSIDYTDTVASDDDDESEDVQAIFGDDNEATSRHANKNKREKFERKALLLCYYSQSYKKL